MLYNTHRRCAWIVVLKVNVPVADTRSLAMWLGPIVVRIPCIHGAIWMWRPRAQPHASVAPTFTDMPGGSVDVMFTRQLSMRMLDRQTSRMDPTHVPPLMEEERVMHSARLLADMPEVPP